MPKGPQGQKRPADVIGNAVKVMRIATARKPRNGKLTAQRAAAELGSRGGKARAAKMSAKQRSTITRRAAQARWRQ
jgi:hypothetical protein